MNSSEKALFLKQRCERIEGAVITELKSEVIGEVIHLRKIIIKQANGNEFSITSYSKSELKIKQTRGE